MSTTDRRAQPNDQRASVSLARSCGYDPELEYWRFNVTLDWEDLRECCLHRARAVVAVPSTGTFHDLHLAIHAALGWYPGRLHMFTLPSRDKGKLQFIGLPDDQETEDDPLRMLDGRLQKLADHQQRLQKGVWYAYDMSKGWEHRVSLSRRSPIPFEDLLFTVHAAGEIPDRTGTKPQRIQYLSMLDIKSRKETTASKWARLSEKEQSGAQNS